MVRQDWESVSRRSEEAVHVRMWWEVHLRASEMARSSEWKLEQCGPAGVEMVSEVVQVVQERVTPLPPRPRIVRTEPSVQAVISEGGSWESVSRVVAFLE